MKTRHLFVSLMTLVLCLTLISGATFALFTSESKVDITVKSGKVSVESVIENLKLYSMDEEQTDAFENGGTAKYENGVLTLDKMTPGDKVTFDIKVTNSSNIDIKYRVNWSVDGILGDALVATADGKDLVNKYWTLWEADAAEQEFVVKVVLELPVEVGNDYQEKSCDVVFTVEAIQANGLLDKYVTPATIDDALANAKAGDAIQLAAGIYDEIVIPQNGMRIYSTEDAVVGYLNINGKDDVTIEGLTFDAAMAKLVYNGSGKQVQPANISGASGAANKKGAQNVVIDGCTFTGTFVDGGGAIAFVDQGRGSGASGNVKVSNCKFEQTGGYFGVYFYYAGNSKELVIEYNEFTGNYYNPVYLGQYQSSVPVIVKENAFKASDSINAAVYLKGHSSGAYNVSYEATGNTFR